MSINLNGSLYVTAKGSDAKLKVTIVGSLSEDKDSDYPIFALVDNGDDLDSGATVRFSLDGESRKGGYTLHEGSTDGRVTIPANVTLRVRHSRKGEGKILATREHATSSVLVKFDRHENPVWVKNDRLSSIAA